MPDAISRPVEFAFNAEKAVAALTYLAERVPSLDRFKIAKLVYLADRLHVVRYGRPIVGGTYWALPAGPVPEELLDGVRALMEVETSFAREGLGDSLRRFLTVDCTREYPTVSLREGAAVPVESLSATEVEVLEEIISDFGRASFRHLYELTHQHTAYVEAWGRRTDGRRSVRMRYEDFFRENPEALSGAEEAMLERDPRVDA